ncbi:hypothetical protein FHX76_000850 [Lysinibacter cavernae]|uniref:Uncharacterized protein n=1 Tax=Lysinibacter cavernae TaxID=1640652 RepID=A0A7X5R043_9MICO|nr:hypothetical protein [Lysinibacter cavernae]
MALAVAEKDQGNRLVNNRVVAKTLAGERDVG